MCGSWSVCVRKNGTRNADYEWCVSQQEMALNKKKHTLRFLFNVHSETRRETEESVFKLRIALAEFRNKHYLKASNQCNFLKPPCWPNWTAPDGFFHSRSRVRPHTWGSANDCVMVYPRTSDEVTKDNGREMLGQSRCSRVRISTGENLSIQSPLKLNQ